MKNIILLAFMIFAMTQMTGCGKDSSVEVRYEDREVIVEVPVAQDFEGRYKCSIVSAGVCDVATPPVNCEAESFLELYADYADRVSFETSGQSLNSVNPQNESLGTHPSIGDRDLEITGDSLVLAPRNYNYSSSTHDIEEDVNGSNITGNRRTDITVKLKKNKDLKLTLKIFDGAVNSNINNIVATRELNCKRID